MIMKLITMTIVMAGEAGLVLMHHDKGNGITEKEQKVSSEHDVMLMQVYIHGYRKIRNGECRTL